MWKIIFFNLKQLDLLTGSCIHPTCSYVTKKKCKAMNKVDRKETEKSISFTTNMWHDGEYRTPENYRL